jgi:antiviral helicase SKI2
MFPDFEKRARVLERLCYISDARAVLLKGRVACEINSCDCVLLSELIFTNFLSPLKAEEICCVLSALVCQEKSGTDDVRFTPFMASARDRLISTAKKVGILQEQAGMTISCADYVKETLNFSLFEVVYEWASGTSFADICKITSVLEGSIVRCITQLDQLCREVRDAARVIGDFVLFSKMEECETKIKRDIVFSASLYVVQ